MGQFSKRNTIFYLELYRYRDDNDVGFFSASVCQVLTWVSKDYYSLPYFAIRKSGIDYIFKTYSARKFVSWEEIVRLEKSVSSFRFLFKSGGGFRLKYADIDYESVQAIKDAFVERDLLV